MATFRRQSQVVSRASIERHSHPECVRDANKEARFTARAVRGLHLAEGMGTEKPTSKICAARAVASLGIQVLNASKLWLVFHRTLP